MDAYYIIKILRQEKERWLTHMGNQDTPTVECKTCGRKIKLLENKGKCKCGAKIKVLKG